MCINTSYTSCNTKTETISCTCEAVMLQKSFKVESEVEIVLYNTRYHDLPAQMHIYYVQDVRTCKLDMTLKLIHASAIYYVHQFRQSLTSFAKVIIMRDNLDELFILL